MESYGIIKIPVATIWEGRSEIKENSLGETVSAISDEGLYGMGLTITGEEELGFYPVRTFLRLFRLYQERGNRTGES